MWPMGFQFFLQDNIFYNSQLQFVYFAICFLRGLLKSNACLHILHEVLRSLKLQIANQYGRLIFLGSIVSLTSLLHVILVASLSPSEHIQQLLGESDDTHAVFCQMDTLYTALNEYQWRETARLVITTPPLLRNNIFKKYKFNIHVTTLGKRIQSPSSELITPCKSFFLFHSKQEQQILTLPFFSVNTTTISYDCGKSNLFFLNLFILWTSILV